MDGTRDYALFTPAGTPQTVFQRNPYLPRARDVSYTEKDEYGKDVDKVLLKEANIIRNSAVEANEAVDSIKGIDSAITVPVRTAPLTNLSPIATTNPPQRNL